MNGVYETLDMFGWVCRLVGVENYRLSQALICS